MLPLLLACARPVPPPPVVAPVSQSFAILSINDTYRIEGLPETGEGGMAKVRSLRQELLQEGPVLVMHAGDFLSPSLLSRSLHGEQMVDLLGWLDGDGEAADPALLVTFGNHEFDRDGREDAAWLDRMIEGSGFTWVSSNIDWAPGTDGVALVASDRLVDAWRGQVGQAVVGVFGLTIDAQQPAYITGFRDPIEVARAQTARLRAAGAHFVVGLTHLDATTDLALLNSLGAEGPDLLVGGHDHAHMIVQSSEGRYLVKADADARSAVVTHVTLSPEGPVVRPEIVHLDMSVAADPEVDAQVRRWLSQHERLFCQDAGQEAPCLDRVLGRISTTLHGEEERIRSQETSLGNWLADLALEAFRAQGAQVALLNSGALRLNQDLPAGTELTQRHLEETLPFPMDLVMVRVDGAGLQAALEAGVRGWPDDGAWPQVAGIAFRHDSQSGSVDSLSLLGPQGPRPLRPQEPVLLVVPRWLAEGNDGYTVLAEAPRLSTGPDLRVLVVQALAAAGAEGVGPEVEGRICQLGTACLLD